MSTMKAFLLSTVMEKVEQDKRFRVLPLEKQDMIREEIRQQVNAMSLTDWLDPRKQKKFKQSLKRIVEGDT